MSTILVTGGAGFIGSNYVRMLLQQERADRVVVLDLLTYAGNLENLEIFLKDPRLKFRRTDIADREALRAVMQEERPLEVVHFAAESHVDRSIEDPSAFIRTNVQGTQNLLDAGRALGIRRMVHVSTDEVYGSLGPDDPAFSETHRIAPNSPYAASKASSDLLVRAAFKTHDFPVITTRCSNNYGPYQFPEKLIPLMIANAMQDQPLPVYGDGMNVRDWIHVDDHCRAIDLVRTKGRSGEIYNIGGNAERNNLAVVRGILTALDKPESLIRYVKDRLGHDRRYAIDDRKIRSELGFHPEIGFESGLAQTVTWYLSNRSWWERIRSGDYVNYYARMYGERLAGGS